jgi:hypothetical protein
MSIGRVVRHFEAIGRVPVDIKDVLALVREIVPEQTIRMRGVNVDPGKLLGTCYRYAIDDSNILLPRQVAYVVYNKRVEVERQRLICCKELLHIIEPNPLWTSTKEQVVHLLERIRNEDNNPLSDPKALETFVDQIGRWHAMSVLFPFGLWEEVFPKVPHELSAEKVADWVELPVDHVRAILQPEWKAVRESLLAFT